MLKLLNVDDNAEILNQLKWGLKKDYRVFGAGDAKEALSLFRKHLPPVVTLDLGLPPDSDGVEEGMNCLMQIVAIEPTTKVIVITGKGEKENALQAIALGAYDFYSKPINLPELKVMLDRAFHVASLEQENRRLQTLRGENVHMGEMIGHCPQMQEIFATIRKVASSDVPVLILGESGTGKELVARAIHVKSRRNGNAFVAINCGAIPETLLESELFGHEKGAFTGAQARVLGKVEYADKGTLFLDEIGELPASLQVNLLRFLQEKVIQRVGGRENIATDTRVLAATNLDVEKAIAGGTFREDLYYRLGVISIKLPPLRERKADIAPLAHYFLQRFAQEFSKKLRGFGPSALEAMMNYGWPGNVRELENKVKRAAIMAEGAIVRPEDLGFSPGSPDAATAAEAVPGPGPETPTRPGPENPGVGSRDGRIESLWEARSRVEADLLARALEQHEGNVARAAEAVGISRPTFYDLMKKHGMRCEE